MVCSQATVRRSRCLLLRTPRCTVYNLPAAPPNWQRSALWYVPRCLACNLVSRTCTEPFVCLLFHSTCVLAQLGRGRLEAFLYKVMRGVDTLSLAQAANVSTGVKVATVLLAPLCGLGCLLAYRAQSKAVGAGLPLAVPCSPVNFTLLKPSCAVHPVCSNQRLTKAPAMPSTS